MAADILITDKEYLDTEDALQKYAYIYKYDYYNRCVLKKLPGAEPIIMVYDSADHLLFTQDGEQRKKGEWVFTVPDIFNRPTVSGICKDIRPDDYKNIVVNAIAQSGNEGFMGTGYQLNNIQPSSPCLLSVSYYDNYDFLKLSALQTVKDKLYYVNLPDYAQQYLNSTFPEISAKSLLTGTRIFMLDNSQKEIITTSYYDDRGRIAQTRSTNQLGGFDNNTFAYTFTGKPIKHLHEHSANGKPNIKELTSYSYDHAERLIKTTHSLNDASPVVLAENSYDELGRLLSKKNSDKLVTGYMYNVRSWLTDINSAHYKQKLYYNSSNNGSIPTFNGNISSLTWSTGDDNVTRGYVFGYDGLNRLSGSCYYEPKERKDSEISFSLNQPNFSEIIDEYDKQGNIKQLTRFGISSTFGALPVGLKFDVIDKLSYTYDGNRIQNIADAATDPLYEGAFNFVDGNKTNEVEYTYDTNGNLTLDKNKGIAKIQYNKLNLPDKLQFAYGHTTEYLYDAAGVKHNVKQTTVKDNLLVPMGSTVAVPADKVAITNQTDYCGNMIYEDGNLKMILTDEGYIDMSTGSPQYCYYIKDHQGNNRVVENQAGLVLQSNHYYPFGMTFGEGIASSNQRYKYNGKELDRMHGLDLYDYGARMYDSAIGRWGTMDPLAEKFYSVSPYAYCFNNPIKFIDPDGKALGDIFKTRNKAAKDWGMYYNGRSILQGKEYGSSIYEVNTKRGKRYIYSNASEGEYKTTSISSISNVGRKVADIHSHGEFVENVDNNNFSSTDKWDNYNNKIDGYLTTPDGSLKMYSPFSSKTQIISKELPSDPKDLDRKNTIAPKDTPKENLFKLINILIDFFKNKK